MNNDLLVRFSILFLSIFIFVTEVNAKTIYVCNSGSGREVGTVKSPIKSIDKALESYRYLQGGDSIAFCRGGLFKPQKVTALFNTSCTAAKPCTLTDYVAEDANPDDSEKLPVIESSSGYGLYFNTRNKNIGDSGRVVKNLHLVGSETGTGILILNGVNDIVMDNLTIENFDTGIHVSNSNKPEVLTSSNVVLTNSKILNNRKNGWLGGASNMIIDNNLFDNNGFIAPNLGHNIYLGGRYATNISVNNNRLYRSTLSENGNCSGVSLVAHGTISNLSITKNHIAEEPGTALPNCYGIGLGPGNASEEFMKYVTINENLIEYMGNVAIGCASCSDVEIKENTIVNNHNVYANAISVPVSADDQHASDRVSVLSNRITLGFGGMPRYIKTGIKINVDNAKVENNKVTIASNDYICFDVNDRTILQNNECNLEE